MLVNNLGLRDCGAAAFASVSLGTRLSHLSIFNYTFPTVLYSIVSCDLLLLKHQMGRQPVLSKKVYSNLSIHRTRNNQQ